MTDNREQNSLESQRGKFSSRIQLQTFKRIFRYISIRVITVLLTVGLGLYFALFILNLGGYVDDIMYGQIYEAVGMMAYAGAFDDVPEEEYDAYVDEVIWQMAESMGLHEPLPIRTARWWFKGITLRWGNTERLVTMDRSSNAVKDVVFESLPYTLILAGAANIVLFFSSLWVAMLLSTRRGKFWDRLIVSLTPISSAPSWVHGVLLLAIFALELQILPFKGMFSGAPPENSMQYVLQILEHMVLPVTALFLSMFFQGVYTWRTFFLVHSGEDYVDLAKAKGIPESLIRKRYLLKPTLPSIITSFAMMLVSFWESAIALEILFNWPGLGALFYRALRIIDRPTFVAIFIIFAYLLGISVILLDIVYAIIDPRVRINANGKSSRMRSAHKRNLLTWIQGLFKPKRKSTIRNQSWQINNKRKPGETLVNQEIKYVKRQKFFKGLISRVWKNIFRYPMAAIGLILIVILFITAIATVIIIPYDKAIRYWRGEGLSLTPRLARPAWTNWFRSEKWPESIYFDSGNETEGVLSNKEIVVINEKMTDIRMTFHFEYTADVFPDDASIFFYTQFEEKKPFVTINIIKPNGEKMEIESLSVTDGVGYYFSEEVNKLTNKAGSSEIEQSFGDPDANYARPLKGQYELQVLAIVFEEDSTVDIKGAIYGKVFGLFGSDSQRRDLTIAMLWGTPIALAFGVFGASLTTVTTILIAAFSAWYGGWLDEILQRITEINITIPSLAMAVLIYILYSKSIIAILSTMILMNIFGNSLKEYRAMFLQFKESPYIEAAKSYGASNFRIIFKYLMPRIVQVMVPQLVISIPSYVFLEATLAFLGVITPYIPTWGKVIRQGLNEGAYWGHYFWILEPIILVLITGLAFAFVGYALEQILNPRLRSQ